MSSLVNYLQYIHFEIYSLVLSFVIVISGCHNTIIRNSEEEEKFIMKPMFTLGNINTADISSKGSLENIVQEYTRISNHTWYKLSKNINITKCSKVWWNNECSTKLNTYCSSKSLEDWKKFKGSVKQTKHSFFDEKIQEITSRNKRL